MVKSKLVPKKGQDEYWEMVEQGIEFGRDVRELPNQKEMGKPRLRL